MVSSSQVLAKAEVDRLTFQEFYAAESKRVFNSAFAFCGNRDAAAEATQEAFARAFARWRRLSQQEWAGAWVTTTALNVLRRGFRDATRSAPQAAELEVSDPSQRIDLLTALRALPPRQRQAAVLYYIVDLPVAVVAENMHLSEGAVKWHLSRARDNLRLQLEERHA